MRSNFVLPPLCITSFPVPDTKDTVDGGLIHQSRTTVAQGIGTKMTGRAPRITGSQEVEK